MYTISCVLLSSNIKMIEIPQPHSENKKATQNTEYFRLSYREWNCWVTKDVLLTVSQPVGKRTRRSITVQTFTEHRSHTAPSFTSVIHFHPEDGLTGQTKLLGWGGGKGKKPLPPYYRLLKFLPLCIQGQMFKTVLKLANVLSCCYLWITISVVKHRIYKCN